MSAGLIPRAPQDLAELIAESRRQDVEISELVAGRSDESLSWRPDEQKWSVLGHLAHLCLVNGPYMAALRTRIGRAGAGDRPRSAEPFRHPRIATWFVRSMEPPPKRRVKTMKRMTPDPSLDREDVIQELRDMQEDFRELVLTARGLDLGRVRFGSPFFPLLRLSIGAGLALILAHNRRHIWLIRELLDRSDAPRPDVSPS